MSDRRLLSIYALLLISIFWAPLNSVAAVISPIVTWIDPAAGSSGKTIRIYGANFADVLISSEKIETRNVIEFFGGSKGDIVAGDKNFLVVVVPAGAKSGPIKVSNGRAEIVSKQEFKIISPVITAFEPEQGHVGQTITIKGENFDPTFSKNIIKFDGIQAVVKEGGPTSLKVDVPERVKSSKVVVEVSNGSGEGKSDYTVIDHPPEIVNFAPKTGTEGSAIVLLGGKFYSTKADGRITENDIVKIDGIKAEILDVEKNGSILVAKVPFLAGKRGDVPVSVEHKGENYPSPQSFHLTGPENAVHFFGGGTAQFWGDPSGDETTKEVLPLFGLAGVHRFAFDNLKRSGSFNPDGGIFVGGELSYRGVAAESISGGDNQTLDGLASAKSIGVFADAFWAALRLDTCFLGPQVSLGGEFLTGDNFKRDAQHSYSAALRAQDERNPWYFFQVGYGNTEYLRRHRWKVDFSIPIVGGVLRNESQQATSFYDPSFTEYYFFGNISTGLGGDEREDDVLVFGIKAVISAEKLKGVFSTDKILADK